MTDTNCDTPCRSAWGQLLVRNNLLLVVLDAHVLHRVAENEMGTHL